MKQQTVISYYNRDTNQEHAIVDVLPFLVPSLAIGQIFISEKVVKKMMKPVDMRIYRIQHAFDGDVFTTYVDVEYFL